MHDQGGNRGQVSSLSQNGSVNNLFVGCLVEAFQMRNVQSAHGLDRHRERVISAAALSQGLSRGPQHAEDLRPIKPLPFTMLAKTHNVPCPADPVTRSWSDHRIVP